MTKFDSHSDTGFKRIASQLRRWIEELRADTILSHEDIAGTF